MKTVLLKDETVGRVDLDVVTVGDLVTVTLWDENGMTIYVDGIVDDILEDYDY